MSGTRRMVRQTLTIARRDFIATVFTPTFLIFLLAPLIMLSFGAIGGIGASTMSKSSERKEVLVVIAPPADSAALVAADRRLRAIFNDQIAPAAIRIDAPSGDPAAQARGLFDARDVDVTAVMIAPLDRPRVLYSDGALKARYLAALAEQVQRDRRIDNAGRTFSQATLTPTERATTSIGGQGQAAFLTVFGLFFLTLLLAGQAVGTLAEERSNKVIEVLAAAVPLESVFLGKLIGMFGVALLFLGFWGTIVLNVGQLLPGEATQALSSIGPAIGWPAFAALFIAYFTMAYMLLGAVFLGIGAQASTPRELQMLSLPITIFQVAMFGLSSAAASQPGSWLAFGAELFPFSSPFAMGARAANSPELWPHLAALAWQLLWVAISVSIGARAFRRGVLQSAGPKFRWTGLFRRSATTRDIDTLVS
ncbi:ABC transporter permease [Sphingomonas japonica]|uniref:ABC-2 type transport system permease protein n=1 Tax=Sphingomonas japonica TaxID=511662 RepID=A0ABX0U1A2_9SPHN|nr:ABC transporter permease [Sphingomonas japonica]NIJ23875.1 ABC-2 type transport system permease protein [Sphingomonas japonica]